MAVVGKPADFLLQDRIDEALRTIFESEVKLFLRGATKEAQSQDDPQPDRFLAFPSSLTSRSRFLLHALVEAKYGETLATVSAGVEPLRRCYVVEASLAAKVKDAGPDSSVPEPGGGGGEVCQTLTSAEWFGKVQTGDRDALDQVGRLPHVVELYGFPATHKTGDLDAVLNCSSLKLDKYYDLVWVDDTHALAVMANRAKAEEALNLVVDSLVKLRPFDLASPQAKDKAKVVGLSPVDELRKRPKTDMTVANRMLGRALGLSLNSAKKNPPEKALKPTHN